MRPGNPRCARQDHRGQQPARWKAELIAMLITSPVTRAKPEDREQIIAICKEDWEENSQFSLSPAKLEGLISRILDKGEGIIGLIRRNSEIEAIMLLQFAQWWYSNDWALEEVINFVRPQFRRSTNAKDMIQFAKRCSDELGIPLIIGVVSNERTAAKLALYERQLGKSVGGYFLYSKKPLVPVVESPPLAPTAVAS